jgi:hypothetical protein
MPKPRVAWSVSVPHPGSSDWHAVPQYAAHSHSFQLPTFGFAVCQWRSEYPLVNLPGDTERFPPSATLPLQPQPTGSNPFRQSMFLVQTTGMPMGNTSNFGVAGLGASPSPPALQQPQAVGFSNFFQQSPITPGPDATKPNSPFAGAMINRPASTPAGHSNPPTIKPLVPHVTGSRNPFGQPRQSSPPPVPKAPTIQELLATRANEIYLIPQQQQATPTGISSQQPFSTGAFGTSSGFSPFKLTENQNQNMSSVASSFTSGQSRAKQESCVIHSHFATYLVATIDCTEHVNHHHIWILRRLLGSLTELSCSLDDRYDYYIGLWVNHEWTLAATSYGVCWPETLQTHFGIWSFLDGITAHRPWKWCRHTFWTRKSKIGPIKFCVDPRNVKQHFYPYYAVFWRRATEDHPDWGRCAQRSTDWINRPE